MFERYTDRARRVVVLAQDEARGLKHNYIGTEHLLLGLLAEGESTAYRALESLGYTYDQTRQDAVAIIGEGQRSPSGHIPFTPRLKKVLELSLREALQLGCNYIGAEHHLLGLVREGEGVAVQMLKMHGDLEPIRLKVLDLLKNYVRQEAPKRPPHATPSAWLAFQKPILNGGGALYLRRDQIVGFTTCEGDPSCSWLYTACKGKHLVECSAEELARELTGTWQGAS